MENESDIIESLTAVGYRGKCLQNDVLTDALNVGTKSEQFREVVAWIAYELHVLRKTDENLDKDTDFNEFAMELSALLKELGCPFKKFIDGPLSGRFQNKQARIQLLEYLITELMTTKMCIKQKPIEDDSFVIPKFETNTARALESITKTLSLGKPPENIASRALFDKLNFKLDEAKRNTNKKLVGESLMNSDKQLSEAQWKKLEDIQKNMDEEYNLRRQTLLTRLDVTVQSFQWSDRMKGNQDAISNKYKSKMKELDECRYGGTDTDIVALLAARDDLAVIEKTSSANVRKNTATKIQKHVIGNVPDRGGRANEHAPPPPEMPSWQTQRSGGGGGGGGRGGFGGGGGSGGGFRGGRGGNRGGSGGGGGGSGGSWQQPSFQGGNYGGGSAGGGGGGGGYQQSSQSRFGSNQGGNFGSNQNSFGSNQGGNFGPNQGGNFGPNQGGNFGPNQGGNFGPNQGGNFGSNQGGNFGSNQGGGNWMSGSGRVQGGWQQRNDQPDNFNNSSFGDNRGNFSNRPSYGGPQQDNFNRGTSNYNRGGGGGGGYRMN